MTTARHEIVVEGSPGVYHCISRCVRRAFLCGDDPYTGKSFEHRKEWVESRLKFLAAYFFIEVIAFAVMSNHMHVVIRNRPDHAADCDKRDIARRWLLLFPKRRDEAGRPAIPVEAELKALMEKPRRLEELRSRLGSVSWFMRSINENIARRANHEDGCKGRFWEGRFKCQALLDNAALLTCMTYVDLNPIRAGIASTPEESVHTSAYLRIAARQARKVPPVSVKEKDLPDSWLMSLDDGKELESRLLNLTIDEYLRLLDWTGRLVKDENQGAIPSDINPILTRLDVNQENWLDTVKTFGSVFYRAAGENGNNARRRPRNRRKVAERDAGQPSGVQAVRWMRRDNLNDYLQIIMITFR